ncbi:MAG: hypothetical protein ABJH68_20955 [Ilumatobacter sp.]|uniref:hypothetical protein n=1 Tax=Ilumatobacter sp. TaxID=1967498 RepID=UPI00329A7ACA
MRSPGPPRTNASGPSPNAGNDALVGSDDLPGCVDARIAGHMHPAGHVRGQSYVTLIDDGGRLTIEPPPTACSGALFRAGGEASR